MERCADEGEGDSDERRTINIGLFPRNLWFSRFVSDDGDMLPLCGSLVHVYEWHGVCGGWVWLRLWDICELLVPYKASVVLCSLGTSAHYGKCGVCQRNDGLISKFEPVLSR